ncbi:MAG TPA: hypothetical protein V6C64_00320 [Microcoleaceae cyanobacterium]|jgi:hypothetical protein
MKRHPPAICHPLEPGQIISSPGCHFSYRIVGACCRLFDREQLPWPCCRLQWRGKEPSWRRIGRRFIVDLATRNFPSYSVEIVGQKPLAAEPLVITLYWLKLPPLIKDWWYADKSQRSRPLSPQPPLITSLATHATSSGGAEDSRTEG